LRKKRGGVVLFDMRKRDEGAQGRIKNFSSAQYGVESEKMTHKKKKKIGRGRDKVSAAQPSRAKEKSEMGSR